MGWPPVRSSRKNLGVVSSRKGGDEGGAGGSFVKVSMDGAPYLRKVDLKLYASYKELSHALAQMFSSFTIGNQFFSFFFFFHMDNQSQYLYMFYCFYVRFINLIIIKLFMCKLLILFISGTIILFLFLV